MARARVRSRWPWAAAPVAAGVVGAAGWLLVRRDVHEWEAAGFTVGPELKFVAFFAAFAGVAAFMIARRWLDGPSVIADDWELSLEATRLPTVAELAAPLERVGYQLRFARLDESGAETGPAAPADSLADGGLAITEARVRARMAGLIVRLTPARDGHYGLGFIEVRDTAGVYAELCQYLIGTLGELVPGVRFKRMGSTLEPDDASTLRAQLAERPAFVDGR